MAQCEGATSRLYFCFMILLKQTQEGAQGLAPAGELPFIQSNKR